MDDLDALTDAQLRQRCVAYGFPNVPVTSTTRKILIKKIRNYLKDEKAKRRRQTSYVTTYSSDEDAESKTPSTRRRARVTEMIRPIRNHTQQTNGPPPGNISPKIYVPDPVRSNDMYFHEPASSYLPRPLPSHSQPSPVYVSNHYTVDGNISNNSDDDEYNISGGDNTSEHSRRLLSLRAQTLRNSSANNNLRKEVSPVVPNFTFDKKRYITASRLPSLTFHKRIQAYIYRLGDKYGGSMIPVSLVSILVVFLLVIAFIYLNKIPDLSKSISTERSFYQLCSDNDELEPHDCADRHSLEAAIQLLKTIVPELQERGKNYHCNSGSLSNYLMSARDVIRHVSKLDLYPGPSRTLTNLHTAEYLIDRNPQWKIAMVDNTGAVLNYEKIVNSRSQQLEHFIVENPPLPYSCIFKQKLQTLWFVVGVISIVGFSFYVIFESAKYIRKRIRANTEVIKSYAEDIILELQNRALNESDPTFIVITHLRDKMIPNKMMKQNETNWNKAIEYLEKHESRIIFDMQIKHGEPFKVMKWIDTHSTSSNHVGDGDNSSRDSRSSVDGPNHNHLPLVKQWHSSAFSTSNNKISNPPTECLKIRNMFEKHEIHNPNLKQNILNAILEKCDMCKICDIQLELEGCCVYLRCASKHDAGIVHNSINGWWFDKNLISIKFLRLERFLHRYPYSMQTKP
ncbi:LEMD3 family protein [Megaselia abdita]